MTFNGYGNIVADETGDLEVPWVVRHWAALCCEPFVWARASSFLEEQEELQTSKKFKALQW
jgi:hypothetical protein